MQQLIESYCFTTISTRRFFWRPSRVELLAMGLLPSAKAVDIEVPIGDCALQFRDPDVAWIGLGRNRGLRAFISLRPRLAEWLERNPWHIPKETHPHNYAYDSVTSHPVLPLYLPE